MSKVGLLAPASDAMRTVVARLGDREALKRARIHPLGVLAALKTYAQGRGMKGQGKWVPVSQVVDALDGAFYLSFENALGTGAGDARARRLRLDDGTGARDAVSQLP